MRLWVRIRGVNWGIIVEPSETAPHISELLSLSSCKDIVSFCKVVGDKVNYQELVKKDYSNWLVIRHARQFGGDRVPPVAYEFSEETGWQQGPGFDKMVIRDDYRRAFNSINLFRDEQSIVADPEGVDLEWDSERLIQRLKAFDALRLKMHYRESMWGGELRNVPLPKIVLGREEGSIHMDTSYGVTITVPNSSYTPQMNFYDWWEKIETLSNKLKYRLKELEKDINLTSL